MYLALYRKYRPKTFDDVISQEHITTTLKNQIINGTAAHAYLFTGSRGTGKTTCAKILSMAVNCLNPQGGNPCMECANCREIDSGAATDIIEMDAASNRGVDDVRRLRDEVAYTPVSCKYRVYIIDEVHMLTTEAFNALLKTLEEPPEHVKFILATTELHKVPATILSRCQRFEFRRIDVGESAERLLKVAEKEGIKLHRDAAELISRLSDGGMRDALSVLDRCISADGEITTETVRSCAGVADSRYLSQFAEMIAEKNVSGCIRQLNELHTASKDIARIVDELSGYFRDLMLHKAAPNETGLLCAMPTEIPELMRISELFSLDDILRCLSLLQQCADSLSKTKQRKTAAEMCFVKMCLGYEVHTAAAAPRIAPASGAPQPAAPVQLVAVEIPQEKFEPTPIENMSRSNADNLSKIRAINEETARIVQQSKIKSEKAAVNPAPAEPPVQNSAPAVPEDFAPPVQNSAPAMPEDFAPPVQNSAPAAPEDFAPPIPEEPPADFAPQREFETSPAPASTPAPTEEKKPEPTPAQKKKAESSAKTETAPSDGMLHSMTTEEWNAALNNVYPMTAHLLSNSSVRFENGTVHVRSSSKMLQDMAKQNRLGSLESELSEALGGKIRLCVEAAKTEQTSEADASAVKQLLEKARQLNIEVIIK